MGRFLEAVSGYRRLALRKVSYIPSIGPFVGGVYVGLITSDMIPCKRKQTVTYNRNHRP